MARQPRIKSLILHPSGSSEWRNLPTEGWMAYYPLPHKERLSFKFNRRAIRSLKRPFPWNRVAYLIWHFGSQEAIEDSDLDEKLPTVGFSDFYEQARNNVERKMGRKKPAGSGWQITVILITVIVAVLLQVLVIRRIGF